MASRFSIGFLLFILAYCFSYSSAAVATLWQEEFKMEMEAKINELVEMKTVQFEEKVTQLEAQLEFNNELRTRLEAKVQEQETILNFLLQANQVPISLTGSKSIAANTRQNIIQSSGKSGIPRTCREFRVANPSLASGMQWIDPDGQGIGDDPIYVYCDMSTGSTSILHDSELPIDVGHCADPGCYSRSINYNASSKQMKSLAELSTECHQSIKYDCYYAPFEFGNIEYAWWNDRDGNAQYFWAGNYTNGIHTCQCGIDGNCVDPAVKCNCDTGAPVQLVDDGVITDKNVLPVTRLNFGRTQLTTSSGVHTLGRLICSGSRAITGFPTSCEDLLFIGHTLNGLYSVMEGELVKNVHCDFTKLPSDASFQSLIGYAEVKPKPTYSGLPTSCANLKAAGHTSSGLYSVKGAKMIENVYCDFTKLPSDSGFQKWIGYVDVKSTPVHFYVQRNSNFDTLSTSIPFQLAVVNEGNAMSLTSGKFTAPRPGTYFFSFTGMAIFPASGGALGVGIYLNGLNGLIGSGKVQEANTVDDHETPLTLQSTLNLKSGDQVWLQINGITTGAYLYDNSNHYNHFTGFMLQEDIISSL